MPEARQFVLNPETGRPAVVVVSHMDIEKEALQTAVDTTSAELTAINDQLAVLEDQRKAKEADHEVAKSELEGYEAVTSGESEEGSAGASGEVEDGAPVEGVEFPQVA